MAPAWLPASPASGLSFSRVRRSSRPDSRSTRLSTNGCKVARAALGLDGSPGVGGSSPSPARGGAARTFGPCSGESRRAGLSSPRTLCRTRRTRARPGERDGRRCRRRRGRGSARAIPCLPRSSIPCSTSSSRSRFERQDGRLRTGASPGSVRNASPSYAEREAAVVAPGSRAVQTSWARHPLFLGDGFKFAEGWAGT